MTESPQTPPPPRRDVAKYVFILAALVFAGIGAWVVLVLPTDTAPLTYRTLAVQLTDPAQAVVTFEVTKEPGAEAECQITATGDDREIVNRLTGIRVPPAAGPTTTHTVTVPTDQQATDATVTYCAVTSEP